MNRLTRSATHLAALELAERGFFVFPCETARIGDEKSGKAPLTLLVPHGKDDATTDAARINEWWTREPTANIGIALEPSDLVALDVDIGLDKKTGKQKQGRESLAQLETEAELTSTLTAIAGGGGLHAYYRRGDVPALQRIGFRPGLDFIGKGYVIAPPSLHWSGNQYRWSDTRAPAPVPLRLVEIVRQKSPAESKPVSAAAINEPIVEGRRNDALFRLGCALRDQGIGEQALKAALHFENQRRFSPPLGDDEVLHVAESVYRRVQPSRDVALGAVIEAIADSTVVQSAARSAWVEEIAVQDAPPSRHYSTGFSQLDSFMGGGMWTRQVCGVIAPPSAGKSAFVGSIANFAQETVPVLHVSTELPRLELMERYAALRGGYAWRDGMQGRVEREHKRELVSGLKIRIVGCDDLDRGDPLQMIAQEATALANGCGAPPLIIIDYVQLLARGAGEDNRHAKVGELTMQMRIMAQGLDCPVLAVFSTRRDFYGGGKLEMLRESDDPTVYLAAAKESGDIEFDCATILFLDIDKLHQGQPKPARIAVARCRVGEIGFAGARAQLDVGKWWGDPSATTEMGADNKGSKKRLEQADRDALRLWDMIAKMVGRPWSEVRMASGFGKDRCEAARARLLEAGRIEYSMENYFDSFARPRKREILKVVGNIPPVPGVDGEPL